MTPAFDGASSGVSVVGSTSQVSLTTSSANDLVFIISEATSAITGVSDTSGLTWSSVSSVAYDNGSIFEIWRTSAPSILSGDTITVTYSGAASSSVMALAISGFNFAETASSTTENGPDLVIYLTVVTASSYLLIVAYDSLHGVSGPPDGLTAVSSHPANLYVGYSFGVGPWIPATKQSEVWTSEDPGIRAFDPYGFANTPDFDTGSSAGVWSVRAKQAEIWTPE